jgi:enterochelin esterase-like enzyme
MKFTLPLLAVVLGLASPLAAQEKKFPLSISITVDQAVAKQFKSTGRIFVFLNQNPQVEPRTQTWPSSGNFIFARNISGWSAQGELKVSGADQLIRTANWTLENVPEGEYYLQVLWDQDQEESSIDAPGNLFAEKQRVLINRAVVMSATLTQVIGPREVVKHELVREIAMKSDTLSRWWHKPVQLKASVLLPANYDPNKSKAYPIRYNVAGYGGRYDRINRLVRDTSFMAWWTSPDAPQVINVFLDGEGPFGDSYQMDSDNSGPYGYSLIHELAPYIEKTYRGTTSATTRFVDGCSTGGWVSLGLQLFYPDFFNGVFSYSPDAIDFEHYQLINIYKDKNAFVNEYGYARPVMRDVNGEPMMSLKEFIRYENVLGSSDSYLTSGEQFSAHTALYSPKGKDGLPAPVFDPVTGEIDSVVAFQWIKYDLKAHAEKNWSTLGPKIQGKIFIWMGDMDHFYLNPATRSFDHYIKQTNNPTSDAAIVFSPMEGHCYQFSHRAVLEKIKERIKVVNGAPDGKR